MLFGKEKSEIFLSICCAFILGNVLFSLFKNMQIVVLCCVLVSVIALFIFKKWQLVLLLLAVSLTASTLFYIRYTALSNHDFLPYVGDNTDHDVWGIVVDEPIVKDNQTTLRLKIVAIDEHVFTHPRAALILYTDAFHVYTFGDRVVTRGSINELPVFEGFNFKDFSLKENVVATMYEPYIQEIKPGPNSYKKYIYAFKNAVNERLRSYFAEPESAFLAGLLIGDRVGLSDAVKDAFQKTGMTHIVAISGYNIAIVVSLLSSLGKYFLKRQYVFVCIIVALCMFVVLTGAGASVVRAAVMGGVILLAGNVGRVSYSRNLLALTAVAMALVNPFVLAYDVGFQLSFFSTVGIVYFADTFEKWLQVIPKMFALRESLALTLVAQVATLPITLLNFKAFSLVSICANVVAAPLIPLAMLFGSIGLLCALFYPPLARIVLYIAYAFLHLTLQSITYLSTVPFSNIEMRGMVMYAILSAWFVMLLFLIYVKKKYEKNN